MIYLKEVINFVPSRKVNSKHIEDVVASKIRKESHHVEDMIDEMGKMFAVTISTLYEKGKLDDDDIQTIFGNYKVDKSE